MFQQLEIFFMNQLIKIEILAQIAETKVGLSLKWDINWTIKKKFNILISSLPIFKLKQLSKLKLANIL